MARQLEGPVAVISIHASPLGPLGRGENGGGNLSVLRLCQGLASLGIPSDVFVRREDEAAPAEEMLAPTSRLVRLDIGPRRHIPKQEVLAHVEAFAAAVEDHAASERRGYAVVHAHYWLGGLVAERLRRAWGTPWVQSFHTLARTKARAGGALDGVRSSAESEMVRRADRLVAGSVAEARDLMRLYGATRSRICVAQPGVDLRALQPHHSGALRTRLRLDGHRVLLFAGRLEPLKGTDTLLDAAALLARQARFDDVVTVVVGDDSGDGRAAGGGRSHLESRAQALGISERLRFVGAVPHEELGDHYDIADLCVVPSRTESFGLVALEAQALGTPVVAAAVGGLTEVVEDGVTGILVPERDDPGAFAAAIASLLDDEPRRRAMSVAARRRAGAFTWERAVERLAAIYGRVVAPQTPSETPCGYADDGILAAAG
ncbi:MAG: glycosyltransferase [Candidatus Dormibacteria bacterium]